MNYAKYMLTVDDTAFGGSTVICLGTQLVQVVGDISKFTEFMAWYAVDVDARQVIPELFRKNSYPNKIGNNLEFINEVLKVDQFLSGVFFAVNQEVVEPKFRDQPDTEDEKFADIGDAALEIRAFDTAYFEIYAVEDTCLKALAEKYNLVIEVH